MDFCDVVLVHWRPTRVEECRTPGLKGAHPKLLVVPVPRFMVEPGGRCDG